MSATHADDIAVTPDNSEKLISLGGEELATAKTILGPAGSGQASTLVYQRLQRR